MDDSHKFKVEELQTKSNELKIPYYYYTEEQASTESSDDSFLDVPIGKLNETNDGETDEESDDNQRHRHGDHHDHRIAQRRFHLLTHVALEL